MDYVVNTCVITLYYTCVLSLNSVQATRNFNVQNLSNIKSYPMNLTTGPWNYRSLRCYRSITKVNNSLQIFHAKASSSLFMESFYLYYYYYFTPIYLFHYKMMYFLSNLDSFKNEVI